MAPNTPLSAVYESATVRRIGVVVFCCFEDTVERCVTLRGLDMAADIGGRERTQAKYALFDWVVCAQDNMNYEKRLR